METFREEGLDRRQHPAMLVACHGPFTWGKDAADAAHKAVALEFIARLVTETLRINPRANPMSSMLLDKHFLRKHGPSAYYGQPAPVKELDAAGSVVKQAWYFNDSFP